MQQEIDVEWHDGPPIPVELPDQIPSPEYVVLSQDVFDGEFEHAVLAARIPAPRVVRRAKLLRPRVGGSVVGRPRLVERLNANLDSPLILVVGPAGYGKTTLICEWLTSCALPSSWLSLDESDGELAAFVAHFIAALQMAAPAVGKSTLELLRSPWLPSPSVLGATLCDDLLDLDKQLVLVLDDYHTIAEPAIHEFVAALLRHPGPALHLVVSSRRDPALPLSLLRMRGQLAELRAADLRFTDEEARAFLSSSVDTELEESTLTFLQERTEGWIAGLRLAALALRADSNAQGLIQAFELHGRHHIMEFLLDEVLARQPASVQTFLLRTSIVDRVCPDLADALQDAPLGLGGSLALLEGLARDHLYVVPLGEDRIWFRYHYLFQELLRHRLTLDVGKSGVAAMHMRASAWYESEGMIEKAIEHALETDDPQLAAVIVERHASHALESADYRMLGRWLALLPDEIVHVRPSLLILLAWSMYLRAFSAAIRPLITAVRILIDDAANPSTAAATRAIRAQLDALSIQAYASHDSPEQLVSWAQSALDALPLDASIARGLASLGLAHGTRMMGETGEAIAYAVGVSEHTRAADPVVHARALVALATNHLILGNIEQADQVARALATFGGERNLPFARQYALLLTGLTAYHRNEVDTAIERLERLVGDPLPAAFIVLRDGIVALGLAYQARGRQLDAQLIAQRLVEELIEADDLENVAIAQSLSMRLATRRGEHDEPARWIAGSLPRFDGEFPNAVLIPAIARLHTLIARNQRDSLELVLQEGAVALERFRRHHHVLAEVETLTILALAHRALGDRAAAGRCLEQAIALAEHGNLIRIFVDSGPRMSSLLSEHVRDSAVKPFVQRLLAAFHDHRAAGITTPPRSTGRSVRITEEWGGVPEQLSERELEVLERLNRRLSNKEIANELFISTLTVKRHASNIYNKLGVENRRQAVRRSIELGLLVQP